MSHAISASGVSVRPSTRARRTLPDSTSSAAAAGLMGAVVTRRDSLALLIAQLSAGRVAQRLGLAAGTVGLLAGAAVITAYATVLRVLTWLHVAVPLDASLAFALAAAFVADQVVLWLGHTHALGHICRIRPPEPTKCLCAYWLATTVPAAVALAWLAVWLR